MIFTIIELIVFKFKFVLNVKIFLAISLQTKKKSLQIKEIIISDEQWERFMADKEMCLSRMKAECRQEGEEERVKREKELLEEIQGKSSIFNVR